MFETTNEIERERDRAKEDSKHIDNNNNLDGYTKIAETSIVTYCWLVLEFSQKWQFTLDGLCSLLVLQMNRSANVNATELHNSVLVFLCLSSCFFFLRAHCRFYCYRKQLFLPVWHWETVCAYMSLSRPKSGFGTENGNSLICDDGGYDCDAAISTRLMGHFIFTSIAFNF